jgi:hypothetical protein
MGLPSRNRKRAQLQLWAGNGEEPAGRPDLAPTTVLRRHPSCPRVLGQIRQVRIFFPELDGLALKVGLTRAAAGFASRDEPWIWVNPRRLSRHTIAHELVHLLQNLGHVPKGERSADLYALARHRAVVDDLPCYLRTPAGLRRAWPDRRAKIEALLHQTALDALAAKGGGETYYLRWFERELQVRWRVTESDRPGVLARAEQGILFQKAVRFIFGRP